MHHRGVAGSSSAAAIGAAWVGAGVVGAGVVGAWVVDRGAAKTGVQHGSRSIEVARRRRTKRGQRLAAKVLSAPRVAGTLHDRNPRGRV